MKCKIKSRIFYIYKEKITFGINRYILTAVVPVAQGSGNTRLGSRGQARLDMKMNTDNVKSIFIVSIF